MTTTLSSRLRDWTDDCKYRAREWRHNRCLMTPVSAIILVGIVVFWIGSMLLRFPSILLSLLLSWSVSRFSFIIEFLYPTSLGRWIHISLAKMMTTKQRTSGEQQHHLLHHSRTLETRIQVTDRVFIHPLPQFLDNIGYLVVCLPPESEEEEEDARTTLDYDPVLPLEQMDQDDDDDDNDDDNTTGITRISAIAPRSEQSIVAFIVDCGDAESVLQLLDAISRLHYHHQPIHIQAILSTHKHHDHTAGNAALLTALTSIEHVYGGAVERVPGCTVPLANGDMLQLLQSMNDEIEVEAIATPGHTRGSLVYCLRATNTTFLFTGDTLFSAGSGVAFESDGDLHQDTTTNGRSRMTPTTFIQANASEYAVERCFAELVARCRRTNGRFSDVSNDRVVLLPGHEYAKELLSRQLSMTSDTCKWKNLAPAFFFDTMSQLYVALHRRSLPQSTGNLLVSLTTLRRELQINPVFRSMQRRGELVVRAIAFWHCHFAKTRLPERSGNVNGSPVRATSDDNHSSNPHSSSSNISSPWNLDAADLDRQIFATVFASDLFDVIHQLKTGQLAGDDAASRLEDMQQALKSPPIGRRPLPDTLPTDRAMYKALVGLIVLGSGPAAMTLKDSRAMKLPAPVVSSSDRILISRSRLVTVLGRLGLLSDATMDAMQLTAMLAALWKEAKAHSEAMSGSDLVLKEQWNDQSNERRTGADDDDVESDDVPDEVELGSLRWALYGNLERPPSFVSKWCMPCTPPALASLPHPADTTTMQVHGGELVRHDPLSCPLCVSAVGPTSDDVTNIGRPTIASGNLLLKRVSTVSDDDELSSIEVGPGVINSFLREA